MGGEAERRAGLVIEAWKTYDNLLFEKEYTIPRADREMIAAILLLVEAIDSAWARR